MRVFASIGSRKLTLRVPPVLFITARCKKQKKLESDGKMRG